MQEDSFNQDAVTGEPPAGLSDGLYPTLVMCKPTSEITCGTTAQQLWAMRGSQSVSPGNTWVPAQAAWCRDSAGQPVAADEASCERDLNTGHVWVPAVAGRCEDASGAPQNFVGEDACETEPSGYEWTDNDNAACAASDLAQCSAAGNCQDVGGVCTAVVAATCMCTDVRCASEPASHPSATDQTTCERNPTSYTWVPPVGAQCLDANGGAVASATEDACVRPPTGNSWELATAAECRKADGSFATAMDEGFCVDARTSMMALCPRGCAAAHEERIFGSDRYAMDAPVCATAVHANALDDTIGGRIYVTKYDSGAEGLRQLQGSVRNGVHSFTWSGSASPQTFFGVSGFVARDHAAFAEHEPAPAVVLGYLGLPVPSNYRPDWSRLTHIAFTGPQIESGGTVSVADLSSAVPLVAEAQRNGVQSILAVRCFSAFVLKAAVSQGADGSTLRARLLLAQNIVQSLAHLPGATGIQLDIQDFHAADAAAYMAVVATVRDLLKAADMGLSLSVTLPANQVESQKFDVTALSRHVDFFVLTGWRLAGRNVFQQPVAVPPSPLYSLAQPGGASLNSTLAMYLAHPGMARERLVLGLPWFGFEWHVDDDITTEDIGAPTAAVDREAGTPALISIHEARRRKAVFNASYDESAAAWWYSVPKKVDGVPVNSTAVFGWLEDERSFAAKAAYALSTLRLGGVAIADLGMEWVDQPLAAGQGDEALRSALFARDAGLTWAVHAARASAFLSASAADPLFADAACCPAYAAVPDLAGAPDQAACARRCAEAESQGCCYWNEVDSACRITSDDALPEESTCSAGNFSFAFDQCAGVACGEHGVCERGICSCDSGYSGELCQTAGWLTDEAVWETLGGLSGSPAQASREAVECDLCVLTFDGKCPSGYEYSWYRFNTEVNFNADDGVGTLPLGFVEAPHNPRITMQTIAFFPRLELCCRIC